MRKIEKSSAKSALYRNLSDNFLNLEQEDLVFSRENVNYD